MNHKAAVREMATPRQGTMPVLSADGLVNVNPLQVLSMGMLGQIVSELRRWNEQRQAERQAEKARADAQLVQFRQRAKVPID